MSSSRHAVEWAARESALLMRILNSCCITRPPAALTPVTVNQGERALLRKRPQKWVDTLRRTPPHGAMARSVVAIAA